MIVFVFNIDVFCVMFLITSSCIIGTTSSRIASSIVCFLFCLFVFGCFGFCVCYFLCYGVIFCVFMLVFCSVLMMS